MVRTPIVRGEGYLRTAYGDGSRATLCLKTEILKGVKVHHV